MRKFTQEELVEKLLAFSNRIGSKNLSKSMMDKDPDMPGSATFKRYFGSWGKALAAAQLETGIITGRPQDPPIFLSQDALDVIEGELLGDGSLDASPTVNACFAHSTANWFYSDFLRRSLCACGVPLRDEEFLPARNNSRPQKRVRSPSNVTFGKLRKIWYPQETKIIPTNLTLNKIRCLHWYLGDGYIEQNTVKFSTCGFTEGEVERLAQLLTELGFKSTRNNHHGYPIVRMSRLASRSFLEWIGSCPVIGYAHKWKITPKQQTISKEQMIQAIVVAMELDADISRSYFDERGEFSSVTAIRLFGSWNNAKRMALESKQNGASNEQNTGI